MSAPQDLIVPEEAKPRPRLTARGRVFALVQLAVLGRIAGLTGRHAQYPIPRRRGKFKPRTRGLR